MRFPTSSLVAGETGRIHFNSFVVEVKNCLLFSFLEPPVPWCFAVSAVYFSEAIEVLVVVASGKSNPFEPVFARQFGTLGLILHVVDNLVSDIVGLQSFIGSVV